MDRQDEEGLILARLRSEGYDVYVWEDPPLAHYPEHVHSQDEVRWVVRGAITIGFPDGSQRRLGPGDRLDVPAGTIHWARVGPAGVRYVCGSRPAPPASPRAAGAPEAAGEPPCLSNR